VTPEHDPYDDHLRAMGHALRTAPGRRSMRHRTRPLLVTGLATAIAAVILVLLLAAPGRSPVDVLGRAEAALAPKGELIHYVVRERVAYHGPTRNTACLQTGATEVWHAPQLNRWRTIRPADPEGAGCSVTIDGRQNLRVRGPVESTWSTGTTSTYVERNDTLDVVRGYAANSSARLVPVGGRELGPGDPVDTLRRMLADGRLRDTGTTVDRGQRLRMLSGTTDRHGVRTAVRYAVGADSFEPVWVATTRQASRERGTGRARRALRFWRTVGPVTWRIDFVRYERLPLDAAGRRLLEVRPVRPVKDRTDMTQTELRRQIKRQTARENREGAARARRSNRERAARARESSGG
jgi:hypothetical protein